MAFHLCIDLSTADIPPSGEGENNIIHVQFYGTGRDQYKVDHEKLDSTLLTEYLKQDKQRQRDGPDLNQKLMKLTFNITPTDEANTFCRSVLERGIFCRQRSYFFLGHSDNQLKKKSCYLMRASHEEIHELLSQFGDLMEERKVGKRARKIGMLFSPLNKAMPFSAHEYRVEPDIKRGVFRSYTFTDGCGFMSPKFSSEVQGFLKLDFQPSAVQVRYRGIEGMLVLKEDLTEVKVQFHNSMQKFALQPRSQGWGRVTLGTRLMSLQMTTCQNYSTSLMLWIILALYVNGYLDTRMVMLLADRGVTSENLEDLQSGYHELLEGMCKETAEYFLRFKGEFRLLQDILDNDNRIDGSIKKRLKLLRKQELDEMERAAYTRIIVPESRVVFAVCDPYNKLKYGECYFDPTMPDDEARGFPAGQKFVVTRNPCYHPGDVRVLKLTDKKQWYENLRDCLVLPVKGPRPHAFECSGGNLGGDKFFVSWDKNLIPSVKEKPCDYLPTVAAKNREAPAKSVSKVSSKFKRESNESKELKDREEMLEYFASFSDEIPKRIEGEYMKCATAAGPSSKECRQLSKMLYQAANFTEDTGTLQKELEQMEPSISSALFSGSPNDQDVEDAREYSEEERPAPEHEITGSSRPPVTSSSVYEDVREYSKEKRPTKTSRPSRPSVSGYEIWEKIDKKAKDFVERMQRETQKSVV
ncbi:hypothetical protein OS493_000818 [Desmophyllum pertusum]|uniref:RNA-dependent RNA polymerase n=1 Tax=Desmophyllum pertusum TaxID=174260 RepID=A0A9W9ZUT4_9CNID|nr:hypothetical protein OS493_000818 [Desmophyllum pertusum]